MQTVHIFLFLIISQSTFLSGQKLIRMIVPTFPVKGQSINLECQPDLPQGAKQLKTIRWYKGNHEFYRYGSNQNKAPLPNLKLSGVNVDAATNINEVVLKNITFATSGDYMCEITLADKSLQIAFGQLRVISPPRHPPEITGVPSWVRTGDIIVGNCTSYHSKPAAELQLYVNDELLDVPHLTRYNPTIMHKTSDEMETSVLGFHFEVSSHNFEGGQMSLKCQSSVLRNITGTTTKILKDATGITHPPELLMPVYTVNPVSIGDQIKGRCSFYYIEEPTILHFYINGEQAFSQITANEAINLKTGVKMTFLNFDFDVIPTYFLRSKQINISCIATLREQQFSKHVVLNETPYIYQILKLMYGIKNSIVTLYNF